MCNAGVKYHPHLLRQASSQAGASHPATPGQQQRQVLSSTADDSMGTGLVALLRLCVSRSAVVVMCCTASAMKMMCSTGGHVVQNSCLQLTVPEQHFSEVQLHHIVAAARHAVSKQRWRSRQPRQQLAVGL